MLRIYLNLQAKITINYFDLTRDCPLGILVLCTDFVVHNFRHFVTRGLSSYQAFCSQGILTDSLVVFIVLSCGILSFGIVSLAF